MEKSIVTISREFGSGGRTIGRLVAEKLGVPCYDRELIEKVAGQTGMSEGYVEEHGEAAGSGGALEYAMAGRGPDGLSPDEYLWTRQCAVLLELAKSPCVLVGRCADYVLRDRPDCVHAFIWADPAFRAERIVRLYGETAASPEKRLAEKDRARRVHYRYFTGREWGSARNYTVCLNSGEIGVERCADILAGLVRGTGTGDGEK